MTNKSTNRLKKPKAKKAWQWINLGQVLMTSSGGTPNTNKKEFWENGDIPWINSGALKDSIISEPSSFITKLGLINSSARIFPTNTVLIALTGSTLGKVGLLSFDCCTNQSITGIYPSKFLNHNYLFFYFLFIRENLIKKAIGAAQPHINKRTIDETLIPIAPIAHQKKAVAILQDVFRQIKELMEKSDKISILEAQAFNGFIQNGKKTYPHKLIGDFSTQRTERIGREWEGKRLIGVSNTTGITDLRIGRRKTFENYKMVYPGDFIYNPMRINIGSIAIYDNQEIALTSPDYVVFSINNSLSRKFLLNYLKSSIGIEQINNNTRGSVRSRLYYGALEKMTIPYCGIKCQLKAETVLSHFAQMKEQTNDLFNNLRSIREKSFQQCFSETSYNNVPFKGSAEELVVSLKKEMKANAILFKKVNKLKIESMARKNTKQQLPKSLIEIIDASFGNKRFTFDSLHSKTNFQYDELKEEVFELIDKKILLEFDEKEQRMFLKLKRP